MVEFESATRGLLSSGRRVFIEISPHPNLTMAMQETAESGGYSDALVIGSLRRGEGDMGRFLSSLAKAHVHGTPVDWRPAFDGLGVERVRLPSRDFRLRPESAAAPEPEAADALLETVLAEVAAITGVAATDAGSSFWSRCCTPIRTRAGSHGARPGSRSLSLGWRRWIPRCRPYWSTISRLSASRRGFSAIRNSRSGAAPNAPLDGTSSSRPPRLSTGIFIFPGQPGTTASAS
jgi:hypothetical protein